MDEHIKKILDHYKDLALDAVQQNFKRDHPLAFNGTPEAQAAGQIALSEKLMKVNWQFDKLKEESEARPEVFEQRVRDQIDKGRRNALTVTLMDAVNQRRDLEENLDPLSQQERLRLLASASERAGKPLPEWFPNAKAEVDALAKERAVRNARDSLQSGMTFGDLDRTATSFGNLKDGSMFRGSRLQLPNALKPPKPMAMPKATCSPKPPVTKEAPAQQASSKPKRPTISGFASSVADAVRRGLGSIKR